MVRVALGVVMLGAWAGYAPAELNLWVSYHFEGEAAYENADYTDAETLFMEANDEVKPGFRLALSYDKLGKTHMALGNYQQAENYLHDALCMKERYCGPRSRPVPTTLNNIADLHYIAGDADKIEGLYRRALSINERNQLSVEVARSLNGMALLHNDAGDLVQAEKLLKRAIKVHNKGYRREHPYAATALTNLGALLINQARYDEAEEYLDRAEFIQTRHLKPDHPDAAIRLHAQAVLYNKTNRIDAAREAFAKAEAIEAKYPRLKEATN